MDMSQHSIWIWVGFGALILLMMGLDLGLLNRKAHTPTYKQSAIWSGIWVSLALCFAGFIFWHEGRLRGVEFLTGYIIELSLSVDNLFVFLLLFSYFKVPSQFQHRVLFWGVVGAFLMRATMIFIGAALVERFHWVLYIFGAFLIYTGINMLRQKETELHPEDNPVVKLVTRFIPITRHYEGEKFFTIINGRKTGTLLLLVLVIVEVTDLVFAVDSIPAIFGVTTDRFIIYTSNVFAILGLRSLFFLLAGVIEKFHYLKIGLSLILTLIGVKMITEHWLLNFMNKERLIVASLVTVGLILVCSVLASLMWPQAAETHVHVDLPPDFDPPFHEEDDAAQASSTAESR